ncbi:MAG: glycogen/starch/alpha-glucan phosphorylase [Planctomycetes bacterium]|nr:glycogen/starch/alpha-glucan phosphorylase [Planctomycetota bacterium]
MLLAIPSLTDEHGAEALREDIHRHIVSTLGNDFSAPRKDVYYNGLAYSVRDRLLRRWIEGQRSFYDRRAKRVYYLSLEFLPGRFLMNYITNLGIKQVCEEALAEVGFHLEDLEEEEWDAGLGNGGLGRLASCYLDSMACLRIPGYGYGIRYDYGIFHQRISNGWQVEECDNWLARGNPWQIRRRGYQYEVNFYGRSEAYHGADGRVRYRWADAQKAGASACDVLIPACGNDNVNNMRLWAAESTRDLDLEFFNQGRYVKAMEAKVLTENISKVLYPNDQAEEGRELRLRQQYFFVAATFQDIMRRFKKKGFTFSEFPDQVAVQLNDTHPAIGIPELMRLLLDEEDLLWDEAWDICRRTFAYTNHTVLPEALETWPVDLVGRVLPRHLEIIYEINRRFLEELEERCPGDAGLKSRLSLIQDSPEKRVRMAHLAIVGSHKVNGVAELHTRILRKDLFREFDELYPDKFINITNGVTPRRWLLQANPALAELITNTIGPDWITDLYALRRLVPHAADPSFRAAWRQVKRHNKERFARYMERRLGIELDPRTLLDVHVKRMHEYKRQLLNVLHAVTLYNRIKEAGARGAGVPRTIIFGGKSAPAYRQAKLIIKLINSVAEVVNADPAAAGLLRVVFLPNYCVSRAEKVIPAADLSEQISTAGFEASGTGNMKFALNGALTIGTLDGANIEIMEEVGRENMFIFGLDIDQAAELRARGYDPRAVYDADAELRKALDMIAAGSFSPREPNLFEPIRRSLLDWGDHFLVLADYRAFVAAQEEVSRVYLDQEEWTRRSILNTANMGKFSSDRAVLEYDEKIWNVKPIQPRE